MFTRMVIFLTRISTQDDGASSVEYAGVMLFTSLVLLFALAVGFDGLLDDIPGAILSALP